MNGIRSDFTLFLRVRRFSHNQVLTDHGKHLPFLKCQEQTFVINTPQIYTFCFDPRFSLGNRCRPEVSVFNYGHVLTPNYDERFSIQCQYSYNFFTLTLGTSSFSLSYWGAQFLLPQRANNGKVEFTQLQNWMTQRVFNA